MVLEKLIKRLNSNFKRIKFKLNYTDHGYQFIKIVYKNEVLDCIFPELKQAESHIFGMLSALNIKEHDNLLP